MKNFRNSRDGRGALRRPRRDKKDLGETRGLRLRSRRRRGKIDGPPSLGGGKKISFPTYVSLVTEGLARRPPRGGGGAETELHSRGEIEKSPLSYTGGSSSILYVSTSSVLGTTLALSLASVIGRPMREPRTRKGGRGRGRVIASRTGIERARSSRSSRKHNGSLQRAMYLDSARLQSDALTWRHRDRGRRSGRRKKTPDCRKA